MKNGVLVVSFCDVSQDLKGNVIPEHEWPSEEYWKREYPHLIPDLIAFESEKEHQQVRHQLCYKLNESIILLQFVCFLNRTLIFDIMID